MRACRILVASGLFVLLMAITSCTDNTPATGSSAAQVTEQFLRALVAGDCEEVRSLVAMPASIDCAWVEDSSNSGELTTADLDKTEFHPVDEGGGSATVEVTYTGADSSDETTSTSLVKTDGVWKVVIDTEE